MAENKWQQARRTLILTVGALAQAAGEAFQENLVGRGGPTASVCCLHVAGDEEEGALTTAVTNALTYISPPNLAALLAEQGWQLQDEGDLFLTFLLDAQPEQGERLAKLVQQVSGLVYGHLGLEPATLLLWLVGNGAEADILPCLAASPAMTRGTAVLSLRNELGLRLTQTADLSHIAAELLWCLSATPLQTLPDRIQAQGSGGFTGDNLLFTIGLHGWVWSPAATQTAFVRRWLGDVLAYWTATTDEPIPAEEASVWLKSQQLSGDAFAEKALLPREQTPPDFTMANSQLSWPWQLQTVWNKLQFALAIDNDALTVFDKHACLRLGDPLYEGTLTLQKEAKRLLDEQPVAAISRTCGWLQTLLNECEQQIERTWDREETFMETMAMLIEERNRVERPLKQWLQVWPGEEWSAWMHILLRPWTWPGLIWRYWQMQRALGQLGIVLTQQAVLQRHIIQNKMARQGLVELIPILRRVYNQVEEVGEMLLALAREIPTPSTADASPFRNHPPLVSIAVPAAPYKQLVPDAAYEARLAAAAIGGLGQQVMALDDSVERPLQRLGEERMMALWQVGCAEVLLAQLEEDERAAHCRFVWEAACPLWRVDEAKLGESQRAQVSVLTAVCGHNSQQLAPYLPVTDGSLWQLDSEDRAHLWLIRVRTGLVLRHET